jgi:hypothetical protein
MNSFKRKALTIAVLAGLGIAGYAAMDGKLDVVMSPMAMGSVVMVRSKQQERAKLADGNKALLALAEAEKRDITDAEKATIDANLKVMETLGSDITRLQAVIESERAVEVTGKILETRPNVLDDPKRGFKSISATSRWPFTFERRS